MKFLSENLYKFKSPWYYWYVGYKKESILCFFASMIISWALVGIAADLSIVLIAIFLLLDSVGFVLSLFYILLLRQYIPSIVGDYFDEIIIWHFVIAFISSIFINRGITYLIAYKWFKLPVVNVFSVLKEPNKSLKVAP